MPPPLPWSELPFFCPYPLIIIRKGNVHAAAQNIPFPWLIFPLSANLRHLCPENNRFFRCLPASDTCVRKRYQILGVNPPLIHSFSNYILHQTQAKCNYIFSICGYGLYYSFFLIRLAILYRHDVNRPAQPPHSIVGTRTPLLSLPHTSLSQTGKRPLSSLTGNQ